MPNLKRNTNTHKIFRWLCNCYEKIDCRSPTSQDLRGTIYSVHFHAIKVCSFWKIVTIFFLFNKKDNVIPIFIWLTQLTWNVTFRTKQNSLWITRAKNGSIVMFCKPSEDIESACKKWRYGPLLYKIWVEYLSSHCTTTASPTSQPYTLAEPCLTSDLVILL